MKKSKSYLFLIIILAACSCTVPDPLAQKKEELDKLKKQQNEIAASMRKLQAEIDSLSGGSNEETGRAVETTTLGYSSFVHYVEVQGKIDAEQNISLSPQMPGTIMKVHVRAGDAVTEGQVLAEQDNQVLARGVEEVRNALAFATDVFQKQKNLWDQKIGTELQFLSAKNNKEAMEKKLATMQEQYDMSRIKSPINGTVDEVMVNEGQMGAPGFPVIRVVNVSGLKAVGEVAETFASKLKKGNEAKIWLPDLGKEIQATISYAGRVINTNNRTFNVEIRLDNTKEDLHPNMIAVLKLNDYRNDSALVVPVNSILESELEKYVYVVKKAGTKNLAMKKTVSVGKIYGNSAEIIAGLTAGEEVITTGQQSLADGQEIVVKK